MFITGDDKCYLLPATNVTKGERQMFITDGDKCTLSSHLSHAEHLGACEIPPSMPGRNMSGGGGLFLI